MVFQQQSIFNIEEFYEIGSFLHNQPVGGFLTGSYRTAIGRYYYYTYLKIRDIILQCDTRQRVEQVLKSSSSHHLVREYMYSVGECIDNNDIIDMANSLEELHELRKKSDYKTFEPVILNDVILASMLSDDINNTIDNVKYGSYIGIEQILQDLRSSDKLPRLNRNGKKWEFMTPI